MSQQVVEDLALFFDFENIAISLRKQNGQNPDFKKIIAWFSQYGRIAVARAYGDWAVHHKFMFPLRENKFEPVFVPTITNHYNGSTIIKNAVDMKIAVEATAVLYTRPHITTYGLLTGDKDYLPLIEHMRNLGKKVIAVAVEENTASSLREAVDLFVPYREVVAEFSEQPPAPVFKLLLQAIHQLGSVDI
ncbi:MAG: NYN domain-containing protein [Ardenticatenaceae bacterium]|nr:NYN domain-containing protein [Ardenticatenaceae bacterium]